MRVAVMSDVHGFSLSLQAVLDDIDSKGPWDRIVVAGDLAEGGPDPSGAVDLIRERRLEAVQGNTDRDLADDVRSGRGASWSSQQLGSDRLDWLGALPFAIRISPPGVEGRGSDLLIVHANPTDMDRAIRPDASTGEVQAMIGTTEAAAIAFGHIHISYIRDVNGHLLVDVSAAGNPKDGDIRSRWGALEWDGKAWRATVHYVDVDTDAVVAQFRASGRPNAEKASEKYLRATYGE